MKVLLTGAAGFIGYHVAEALLAKGAKVIGIDNLNDYYDVKLKKARLARLKKHRNFSFRKIDVSHKNAILPLAKLNPTHIVHLAGQAGVRYSLTNPYAYIEANVMGQTVMLELARKLPKLKHFVYASSSSVYGGNTKVPFSVRDPVEKPISLYASTKRADELIAYTYAHLFRIPCTGLRFFTVYGPWGRPDMAAYIFAKRIMAGQPINVFNRGHMRRDFTYIDDIVVGVLAVLAKPPKATRKAPPVRLYNLGNAHAENLMDFIAVLEKALGRKAHCKLVPLQPGDVPATSADISVIQREIGFKPKTGIKKGIPKFVAWYKDYHKHK